MPGDTVDVPGGVLKCGHFCVVHRHEARPWKPTILHTPGPGRARTPAAHGRRGGCRQCSPRRWSPGASLRMSQTASECLRKYYVPELNALSVLQSFQMFGNQCTAPVQNAKINLIHPGKQMLGDAVRMLMTANT